jgi:RHS repeat-associated protein
VPEGWVQTPKTNTTTGSTAGAPISWNDPTNPEDATAGYGYIADDTTDVEDIYFFHSDHLGSTSYVTDKKGNVTQYDAYLPYGELLVDEHSSSEDMPYKFNGKEMGEETGLYYYGARYMNPVTSLWYGVDPLARKYPNISPYVYCHNTPIRLIDPNGMDDFFNEKGEFVERTSNGSAIMVMSGNQYKDITTVNFSNNKSVIQNIGTHYLAKADKNNFNLTVSTTGGKIPIDVTFSNDPGTMNYDIYITDGFVNKSLGNCYDFECITFHEYTHRYDKSTLGGTIGETNAIIRTATECSEWNSASDDFIQSQASYAVNSLNDYAIKNNTTISNEFVTKLNNAFIGYATFDLNDNRVSVSNSLQGITVIGQYNKNTQKTTKK